MGSSPLARGLPSLADQPEEVVRIIPARAGFTHVLPPPPVEEEDHPRSRGVYPPGSPLRAGPPGSSPLARGLRHKSFTDLGISRIIPARAGFTARSDQARPDPADHPRSRGVYNMIADRNRRVIGSSPLARGLHGRPAQGAQSLRIIPARAGFTEPQTGMCSNPRIIPARAGFTRDRSRPRGRRCGSSPLARGLPRPGSS